MTNQYVIVEHAGEEGEAQQSMDFATLADAMHFLAKHYTAAERQRINVDIMKRLPNGSLTTEY